MVRRFVTSLVLVGGMAVIASAQSASRIPRLPDGHPDLQGMYDLAMLTPMERPSGLPAVLTDEQAAKLEQQAAAAVKAGSLPIDGNRKAPPQGGDGSVGPAGNVGGYNSFWIDRGTQYSTVDGQKRSSIVMDPPDGHVPPLTAEARQRQASRFALLRTQSDATESTDPGLEPGGAYDDPERRSLAERCLLGFSSTSGPPILPNYFYNNLHQIVQTPDTVMILTEMVHDARIVRIGGQHAPPTIRKWLGDSIGRWEGDTLVVETTNFTDKTRFRGTTEHLKVTEHFTRVDAKTLKYRFTIDDPKTWDRPWTGEYTWPITQDHLYEYACHEGNYAMGNILRGARLRETQETKTKSKQQ
jgi:hypothetical protein